MDGRLAISVPEAAKRLGVSKTTAYELARREDFPAFSVGKRFLVSVEGLERWIKAQAEKTSD